MYSIHLKDTQYCTFCKNEIESIEHLFFDCRVVKCFWGVVSQYLQNFYDEFELNRKNVLLGFLTETSYFNFLIIVIKNYIYHCKLKEKYPNIIELKSKLYYLYHIEEFIALKNNHIEIFERKWTPLKHIFP